MQRASLPGHSGGQQDPALAEKPRDSPARTKIGTDAVNRPATWPGSVFLPMARSLAAILRNTLEKR